MAPRKKSKPKPPASFDPGPSLGFGKAILSSLRVDHALVGKIAMWYWLENEADHEYTKDVDFAVPQSNLPQIIERLRATKADVAMLQIGGVSARIDAKDIRVDFIHRSSAEWGNLQPLFLEAIREANLAEDRSGGVPVASPEHLVLMTIGAGTDKDERDAIRLLAKVEDLDVARVRERARTYLGASGVGRLEECLRRAGHPMARRAYTEHS